MAFGKQKHSKQDNEADGTDAVVPVDGGDVEGDEPAAEKQRRHGEHRNGTPVRNAGSSIIASWKGMVVFTPSTTVSSVCGICSPLTAL